MTSSTSPTPSRPWAMLFVVCLAQLMIVLDATIVNVALPTIQDDLGFSDSGLTWVVNAFLVSFGSLLLLAGRLGDLAGRRAIFLGGVTVFTVASVLCGLAPSGGVLVAARFLQGIGAAAQASVILAIIVTNFSAGAEQARAMSAYVFVSVAGGSLGLLAGGLLTEALSWHWVFFINVPIGIATVLLGRRFVPADHGLGFGHHVDWTGAALVTSSLMVGIYAIVQVSTHGWLSEPVLVLGAVSVALMTAFVSVERRVAAPIMPLRILSVPGLVRANTVRALLVTGMYSTFFLGTLYLERVRGLSAIETGAAFLPWTLTVAVLSRGVTTRTVARFGPQRVLVAGMASASAGLLLFSTAGEQTAFFPTIFFACFAIGLGIGSAFQPLLSLAMAEVPREDAGLGSGLANVSQQLAGAFGVAVLSTLADNHTKGLVETGHATAPALVSGYHLAFLVAAAITAGGAVLATALLRPRPVVRNDIARSLGTA
ncbi:MFS transporter [Paraconexibacter antarcticus]|uniref:MFS transporter n=1 Tax=Paraconexibacter antarcticus TaxID=2949664 RepID=A0ABY5DX35_9ACTN|nr:MFS transporter [Paraconexibacter antarcticus]UTI66070.1 MFS transporter [Paraconexibacter antarcticus]